MPETNEPPRPRRAFKICLYVGVWIAALVMTDPTLKYWPFIYMFPMGLPAFFVAPEHRQSSGLTVLIAVWCLYLVHAVFFFRARTHQAMLILLGILAILFVFNAVGCREMIHTH